MSNTSERRLDALILSAFESACEAGDMEVAETLHLALKKVFGRETNPTWTGQERRADPEVLIDAFRKLERMFLRNADDIGFETQKSLSQHHSAVNESQTPRTGIQSKPSGRTVH